MTHISTDIELAERAGAGGGAGGPKAAPNGKQLGRQPTPSPGLGKRHLIVLMATLCPLVCYISRQTLSMAMVAMVRDDPGDSGQRPSPARNATHPVGHLLRHHHNACPVPQDNWFTPTTTTTTSSASSSSSSTGQLATKFGPSYAWNAAQKSLVFEAFFWTYFAGQIPGARFAELAGAKWALVVALFGSSLLSLLAPWCASLGHLALAANRALLGVCQAALFPACYVLYSHWLPPLERSQALPVLGVGTNLGSIFASTAAGYFIQAGPHLGWPYAFYLPGLLCALLGAAWLLFGASEPHLDKSITRAELHYIESRLESKRHLRAADLDSPETNLRAAEHDATATTTTKQTTSSPSKQISWKKVFSSASVWVFMMANFATEWPFLTILLLLPAYLNDIQHLSPLLNGMINSTIYVLYCVASPLVGALSTWMIKRRTLSLGLIGVRRLFECTALFGQTLCFTLFPLIGCDLRVVLGVLFTQKILFSFVNGGEVQLPSEMSLDFSGTIYAVGNCAANAAGFIVPRVHSWLVVDSHDRDQWQAYFWLVALVTGLCSLVFLFFSKAELEDFGKSSEHGGGSAPRKRSQNGGQGGNGGNGGNGSTAIAVEN